MNALLDPFRQIAEVGGPVVILLIAVSVVTLAGTGIAVGVPASCGPAIVAIRTSASSRTVA